MMTSHQKELIYRLLKRYARSSGTDVLVGLVADTNGMLDSCRILLNGTAAHDGDIQAWLTKKCGTFGIDTHTFLLEVGTIVAWFSPRSELEDLYEILGVPPDADLEEIKQRYRQLSLKYHPDTAADELKENPEQFIRISEAYQRLLSGTSNGEKSGRSSAIRQQWRQETRGSFTAKKRKRLIVLAIGVSIVLFSLSIYSVMDYRKRTMLAGLQGRTGGAASSSYLLHIKIAAPYISKGAETHPATDEDTTQPGKKNQATVIDESEQLRVHGEIDSDNILYPLVKKENNDEMIGDEWFVDTYSPVLFLQKKAVSSRSDAASRALSFSPYEMTDDPGTNRLVAEGPNDRGKDNLQRAGDKNVISSLKGNGGGAANRDKGRSQHLKDMATSEKPAGKVVDLKRAAVDEKTKIDHFLKRYVSAYEQRDITMFMSLFDGDVQENGKPFSEIYQAYKTLFDDTTGNSLQITDAQWQEKQDETIVEARFTVYLKYKDGHEFSASGPIRFILMDDYGSLRVKLIEYTIGGE